jgi:hypothetical protein
MEVLSSIGIGGCFGVLVAVVLIVVGFVIKARGSSGGSCNTRDGRTACENTYLN